MDSATSETSESLVQQLQHAQREVQRLAALLRAHGIDPQLPAEERSGNEHKQEQVREQEPLHEDLREQDHDQEPGPDPEPVEDVPQRSQRRPRESQYSTRSDTSSAYVIQTPAQTPTIDLTSTQQLEQELDSLSGFLIGSSPRRPTPARTRFEPMDDAGADIVEGNSTLQAAALEEPRESIENILLNPEDTMDCESLLADAPDSDEDFHFGTATAVAATSVDAAPSLSPVYAKIQQSTTSIDKDMGPPASPITHRMMMSRTPSESAANAFVPTAMAGAQAALADAVSSPRAPPQLTPVVLSVPSTPVAPSMPTPAAEHTMDVPPVITSVVSNISSARSTTSTVGNANSQKFLINSLQHTVIKVETVVDPIAILNAPSTSPDYFLLFKVFSNESTPITPMYRLKRNYKDFLAMEPMLRSCMPFLPHLPEMNSMKKFNYRLWEQNKLIIESFIDQALDYLKRGMPNTENCIHQFTSYFEFQLDEASPYLLDLSKHWDFLLIVKQKFPNKTFDILQLTIPEDRSSLVLMSKQTGKAEHLPLEETSIGVYANGQEIVIKRKKKLKATKTYSLYAQSQQDAYQIVQRLKSWSEQVPGFGGALEDHYVDDGSDSIFGGGGGDSPGLGGDDESDHTTASNNTSPSVPWTLFGKRSSKLASSIVPMTQSNPPQSPRSGMTTTTNGTSSPSKSIDSVMVFKAQPYEGKMTTGSPQRRPLQPSIQPPVFEPPVMKYFGNTLQAAFDMCPKYQFHDRNVPSIIYQCLGYLHSNSAEAYEGLFRLNGKMSEVNSLQKEFNTHGDYDMNSTSPDVYSVATLMKRFLRNVEGGVILEEVCEKMANLLKRCPSSNMGPKEISEMQSLLKELPRMNMDVICVVFGYLQKVLDQGVHNKMTVKAMKIVIGPNITVDDSRGIVIAEALMDNYSKLFSVL